MDNIEKFDLDYDNYNDINKHKFLWCKYKINYLTYDKDK